MKPAVFQVDQRDGFVRLVCIHVSTLRNAVELEAALRERLPPGGHVALLGRFDRIEMALSAEQLLDSVFKLNLCNPRR